jgi:hypothetical protein
MELQEFPGCVGVGEGGVEEVDLGLSCVVAGCRVGVTVNRCVLLMLNCRQMEEGTNTTF